MKKKIAWTTGGLIVLALLAWAFMPRATEVEVAKVTQGRFERSVMEDGKTRLRDRYVVSTPLTGRVARIALRQGDSVALDATVATLWPLVPAMLDERARDQQNAHVGTLEASVSRAKANVGHAVAALEQARADLKRNEALAKEGFISPTQNETGRLTLRLREQELESARQEENGARHELDQSRIALRQYSSASMGAQQRPWQIKAPVSGKILKIQQQSEGMVQAGTALMEVGDPTQLEVVVDVLTEDAAQITPGTPVQLSNWGGSETLEGRVRLIEPAAFTKVSALGVEEQRVNAVIDITSAPDKRTTLGDGFKVDVRVLVQVVENAIKIPVSALFPVGSRSALFVVEGGRARQREIEVSARNGVEAWVKTGLAPGTSVIVYPPTSLQDGARVTTR